MTIVGVVVAIEFALSDLAASQLGTDANLSTALRDILTAALQELIEAELSSTIRAEHGGQSSPAGSHRAL